MARQVPTLRKQLSTDALLSKLRSGFAALAEHRPGTPHMSLTAALLAALALFSLQSSPASN